MMSAMIALLLTAPQDSLEKRLPAILERLRADDIEQREGAAKELITLGESAIETLEKAAGAASDGETAARLKAVVVQIRRNALVLKVAPPAKSVTVSATDVPLREFLKDVCGQAGVDFTCDGATGDRPVTVEAKNEPLLQVVDRACAARGDLVSSIADGRLKIAAGKGAGEATAYAEGYRLRVRKTVLTETIEAGATRTSITLYLELDAQPDQKIRGTAVTLPRAATVPGGGEVAVKGVTDLANRMAGWAGSASGAVVIDGVAVTVEAGESCDRICLIKEVPAGLTKLDSLKIGARFRYSVGLKPITVPLNMRSNDRLPDIPYNVVFTSQQLYFMPIDASRPVPLEDFIDLETMTLVGKDGKESKLTSMAGGMRRGQYYYQVATPLQNSDSPQLRLQVFDAFDRDVEFELKDVRLRDRGNEVPGP
jgi:hypothetical protein